MRFRPPPSLLFRNPVFRDFLSASTVSQLGASIFDIAMPLYVLEKTQSAMHLALVKLAIDLPYFLMAPFTGYSVDNFDKRRMMLASDLGQVLCMLFLLVYDVSGTTSIVPLVGAVFVTKSLMITFETITTFKLIPALVTPQDLGKANTWFLASLRLIQIVGPITAGVLMSVLGVKSCILVNMLSFGATLYFVFRVKNLSEIIDGEPLTRGRPALSMKNLVRDFRECMAFVTRSPVFRPFVALMFLWNFSALLPASTSVTYYLTATKGFSPVEYGAVISLIGVFGITGYFLANLAYDRMDFARVFVGACVWQAVLGTLAVCFLPFPWALAVIFAVSRTGSSMLNMGTFLIRQTRVPKARMGGINASLRMFFMSAAPVSALLQGWIISRLGVGVSLVLGAASLWGVLWYARAVARAFEIQDAATPARAA